ncbi:23S rRNA (guanosine(2251)-2'-O)-methyltransferase RlmB [Helcococcus ovis]|uniref:23S rRNA (Guanosine(2251)-2'-O)-methyltransferase RlmB n=1 Tax=Helcococcus ovis TaxID=72026 RepID=A0A4R9C2W6_9FIRM|nr:23S rRNA (guanosine(2251)-2'-O)-methyltransferase RlmB [Helcococcus ovis]TFF64292.1 23S rRNA (guanosine(2251)-2'-O)-methyltransferase RlmB [Helcococcus ovis]TFF66549.1 23S rRNA (guanosine(2251)-2'-O)-methyltransferase RlmB [Helcococcus ovis]
MSDYIFGRNSVIEYLENMDGAEKLYIQNGNQKGAISKIIKLANEKKISIVGINKNELDKMTNFSNHQGVYLQTKDYEYSTLEDIIEYGKKQEKDPLIVLLDEITDPHNLGAIIRTSEAAGATGVIITKHRSAGVNNTVHKTSAGATVHMKVAMVTNLNQTIEILKNNGYWIYGADGHTDTLYNQVDFSGSVGLVIGNEGKGISKLTKQKCDYLIKIPMYGKTESLNASVSASILIYGIINSKHKI